MATKTNTPKLTGGKRGWSAALDDAYYGDGRDIHSPCIRYSHERGFFVESLYTPTDPDVIWSEPCGHHANTGQKFHKYSDYGRVRREILGEQS